MTRDALAWGALAALVVLVARQTMTLAGVEHPPGWLAVLAVAVVAAGTVAAVATWVERRPR